MLDYSPDEETLKNDKKKIAILISIIVFVVILIVLFGIIVFLDMNRNDEQKKISTTTRRTVNVTESNNNNDFSSNENNNNDSEGPFENNETTTTTSTTVKTTSATKTGNSATQVITSTKIITSTSIKVVEILPPAITHETTSDSTTYPDSLDDWEWGIVNLINEERRKNGLNELLVARDLRQLAEEAADLWLGSGSEVVKEYLTGHSNYRKYTNYNNVTPTSLYEDTIAAIQVTTNPALRYLGVGVLYKSNTYYYVIIYE